MNILKEVYYSDRKLLTQITFSVLMRKCSTATKRIHCSKKLVRKWCVSELFLLTFCRSDVVAIIVKQKSENSGILAPHSSVPLPKVHTQFITSLNDRFDIYSILLNSSFLAFEQDIS